MIKKTDIMKEYLEKSKSIIDESIVNRGLFDKKFRDLLQDFSKEKFSKEDCCNFFTGLSNYITQKELPYDIKSYLSNKVSRLSFYNLKIDNNFDGDVVDETMMLIYKNGKGYRANIIAKHSVEILEYLNLIGYDTSSIKDGKYFLNINFYDKFKVEFYDRKKILTPYYCKKISDVKDSLANGTNLDIHHDAIHGKFEHVECKDYETFLSLCEEENRKKLKNIYIDENIVKNKIDDILKLNISDDVKLHVIDRYLDGEEKEISLIKIGYYIEDLDLVEVENNKENIKKMEQLGYDTRYTEFNRLFVDFKYFDFYNIDEDFPNIKLEKYIFDKILK